MDRIVITFIVMGVGVLLWWVWQYYKASTIKSIQITDITEGKPNLLYFMGQYCGTCKVQQTPIIETMVKQFGDSIAVKKYDVSHHPELTSRYKILTLPTTIVVNGDGEVTHINRGIAGQQQLETQLLA